MSAPGDFFKRNNPKQIGTQPTVKRFTDVDTDSDIEVTPQRRASAQTMESSTLKIALDNTADSDSSIQFDSETERDPSPSEKGGESAGNVLPVASNGSSPAAQVVVPDTRQAVTPPIEEKAIIESSTSAPHSVEKNNIKGNGHAPPMKPTTTTSAAGPPSVPSASVAPKSTQEEASRSNGSKLATPEPVPALSTAVEYDDEGSDGYAEEVLPSYRRTPAVTISANTQTPLRRTAADRFPAYTATATATPRGGRVTDEEDALLVRAQLRLQEKRRLEGLNTMGTPRTPRLASTPRTRGGVSPLGRISPARQYVNDYPDASSSMPPRAGPSDARAHRLAKENCRLQEEIKFLRNESQKLRAAAGTSDSAELIKAQLTADILRKELHTKEMQYQQLQRESTAESASLKAYVNELIEESEGYRSSSSQYHQLYKEKIKELTVLKTEFQNLVHSVNSIEQQQGMAVTQHQKEIAAERERSEKLVYLNEEVKRQRQHLQDLNAQLQSEITALNEERVHLKDECRQASDASRRVQEVSDTQLQSARQEIDLLQRSLEERDKLHATQLRQEQRASATAQSRLRDVTEELSAEIDRLRRQVDSVRQEGKTALQREMDRVAESQDRIRSIESESKAELSKVNEAVAAEYEHRIAALRDALSKEKRDTGDLRREADALREEVSRLAMHAECQARQYDSLSVDFHRSEELRAGIEQRCNSVSAALDELMVHDEQQSKEVADLRAQLSERQQVLQDMGYSASSKEAILFDVQQLSEENERLTAECIRIAGERDSLIEENGRIAEELLKWKGEMRQFVATQMTSPSPRRAL